MVEIKWDIEGQPEGSLPVVGQEYEIRDSRKGTYCGKILAVRNEWADVQVTQGEPHFVSHMAQASYDGFVAIRFSQVNLIPKP